ncbi:hypothetical protein [Clostridium sp. MD294]|uniref:hypothetical protein n=1 Tax=Clostridium sp. MD294 TaxID=97138 RepID=UPI00039EEDA3|nr:hypothetical protein [Clostridium sp. MD294]
MNEFTYCIEKVMIIKQIHQFAVDIIEKYMKQNVIGKLNIAEDFKFLCKRYD